MRGTGLCEDMALDATLILEPSGKESPEKEEAGRSAPVFSLISLNPATAQSFEVPISQLLALTLQTPSADGVPLVTVGRERQCHVALDDPRVSSRHFEITASPSTCDEATPTTCCDVDDFNIADGAGGEEGGPTTTPRETAQPPSCKHEAATSCAPIVDGTVGNSVVFRCTLIDRSTNGTMVNGKWVGKGRSVSLHSGDEVVVLPPQRVGESAHISFVFRNHTEAFRNPDLLAKSSSTLLPPAAPARSCDSCPPPTGSGSEEQVGEDAATREAQSAAGQGNGGSEDSRSLQIEEHLSCPICSLVFHKCVAVFPCLHNFCAGCFSDWAQRSPECPMCRKRTSSVVKNHAIDAVVDAYLQAYPDKRRTAEDLREMDAKDRLWFARRGDKVAFNFETTRRGRRPQAREEATAVQSSSNLPTPRELRTRGSQACAIQ